MSSCCDNHTQPTDTSIDNIDIKSADQEPKNLIERFFWKIGQADAKKQNNNGEAKKGCC